jgi:hypothetical protein
VVAGDRSGRLDPADLRRAPVVDGVWWTRVRVREGDEYEVRLPGRTVRLRCVTVRGDGAAKLLEVEEEA